MKYFSTDTSLQEAFPLCHKSQFVHREVNLAIRNRWTLGEFVQHHISPKSHNFSSAFTQTHIIDGGRIFHDPCHPILALAYKQMGIDTSQFRHWYNGNNHAESLVVPMEVFFNDMSRDKKIFSLEYYKRAVHKYYRGNAMKDRSIVQRAIKIVDACDKPTTVFNVCRQGNFETEQLMFMAAKAFRDGKMNKNSSETETKWGEVIGQLSPWPDAFLEDLYAIFRPALDQVEYNIRSRFYAPPDQVFLRQTVKLHLEEQYIPDIFSAMGNLGVIEKTTNPTPSP